jgi:pyruvate kinase
MRRTRILATIGPASRDPDRLRDLIAAGVDACRINFSHGSRDEHAETCRMIRQAAVAAGRPTAILQDLAGPKIRLGPIPEPFDVAPGETLVIAEGVGAGGRAEVFCGFEALFTSAPAGTRLLIDDGRIEVEVTEARAGRLSTRVVTGGTIEGRKGINVPGASVKTSALTPRDADDLRAGIAMGVDMVALSFVQSASDVVAARAAAVAAGAPDLPIVAKIEKPRAVDAIDEILAVADGLMVARGDLGIELPFETLPGVQHRLLRAARRRGVPAIVATQVFESMRTAKRPTRAEVTDAAHAVDGGADAIMLAGETATGAYPVDAVRTLAAVLEDAERNGAPQPAVDLAQAGWSDVGLALGEAAVALAERARAEVIVAVTGGGRTARMLAALRPRASLVAATASRATAARLALVWGVSTVVTEHASLAAIRHALLARGLASLGQLVVFVSMDAALGREDANFVHVERL